MARQNLIIKEVRPIFGQHKADIEGRNYRVSFLNELGREEEDMWLSGPLLNSITTHLYVKKKYVYEMVRGTDEINLVTLDMYYEKESEMLSQKMGYEEI